MGFKHSDTALYWMRKLTTDRQMYTNGRIVTGANPTSAHMTVEEVVKAVEKL